MLATACITLSHNFSVSLETHASSALPMSNKTTEEISWLFQNWRGRKKYTEVIIHTQKYVCLSNVGGLKRCKSFCATQDHIQLQSSQRRWLFENDTILRNLRLKLSPWRILPPKYPSVMTYRRSVSKFPKIWEIPDSSSVFLKPLNQRLQLWRKNQKSKKISCCQVPTLCPKCQHYAPHIKVH